VNVGNACAPKTIIARPTLRIAIRRDGERSVGVAAKPEALQREGGVADPESRSPISWRRLQAVDEVGCTLRVVGRGEDRAMVCLEDLQ
jgi:hypothetical protein